MADQDDISQSLKRLVHASQNLQVGREVPKDEHLICRLKQHELGSEAATS